MQQISRSAAVALAFSALAGSAAYSNTLHDATTEGLTYSLTASGPATSSTDTFTLNISGINGPSDTRDGRFGVEAFAFNPPANLASATALG